MKKPQIIPGQLFKAQHPFSTSVDVWDHWYPIGCEGSLVAGELVMYLGNSPDIGYRFLLVLTKFGKGYVAKKYLKLV